VIFYLGSHRPNWLELAGVPLFVSHRTLRDRKTLPRAAAPWALDSGGFTELSLHGRWVTTPADYAAAVRRYRDEVGLLAWASPQDWMNEPPMLAKTGLTVAEHQRRTVENLLELRELAPDLPFVPVLQGWEPDDYLRCADLYAAAGVDLAAEHTVGVGTVCRRQDTHAADVIFSRLGERGIRLHGFGIKLDGIRQYGHALTSSDSMAWSYWARRDAIKREQAGRPVPACGKRTCANCLHYALAWRDKAMAATRLPQQLSLAGVL
jgi:hypothetical protein